jgi:hypothetical protein
MNVKTNKNYSLSHSCALGQMPTALMALAVLVIAVFYSPTKVLASDHRESPIADANVESDITDVFAFLDPNDPSQLVLIMGVNSLAVPAEFDTYRFSPDTLYQFKIAHDKTAVEDLVIQAVFADVPTTTCASGQTVSIYGPSRPRVKGIRNIILEEQPALTGCTGQTVLQQGSMQVFVGLRDDPFVADVGQLKRITSSNQDVFRDFPGFALGPLRGRPVRADHTSGVDALGGFNLTAIEIRLPKSEVAGSGFLGTPGLVGIWGTTSLKSNKGDSDHDGDSDQTFVQIQRAGQQLIKTTFVPPAMRDFFNATNPVDDMKNFSSLIPDALTTTDNDGTGNTIAGRAALLTALGFTDAAGGAAAGMGHGAPLLLPASFNNTSKDLLRNALLPDVLRLNLNVLPAGILPGAAAVGGNADPQLGLGSSGLQNGRRPADSVIDILLQFARQLADVNFPSSLGVHGSGPARPGALNFPANRQVFVVLEGTLWNKPDSQVGNVSGNVAPYGGNDLPELATFPFLAAPHPLPGEPGTINFPVQQ